MEKYHYTYIIWCPTSKMKYIGCRTSKCLPHLDVKYWGSSKHLPKDVHETHRKRVLCIHPTRKDALAHEILLHSIYNVAKSSMFYNKARQTSTGWSTEGVHTPEEVKVRISATLKNRVFSEEHRKNISKAVKGRIVSEEAKTNMSIAQKKLAATTDYVNPRKGCTNSEEHKEKWRESMRSKGCEIHSGSTNPRFKPWFIYHIETKEYIEYTDKTKEQVALELGLGRTSVSSAFSRSKGIKPITFLSKLCIIGNKINKQINKI